MRARGLSAVIFLVVLLAAARAEGQCTAYVLSPVAPPAANWTDPTVWVPAGYPGTSACDTATAAPPSATTLTVDSSVGVDSLNFSCGGCVIEIVAGGQLTVDLSGTMSNGASILVNGGTLVVDAPGPAGLAFSAGSGLTLRSGTLSGSGTVSFASGTSFSIDGGAVTIDGVQIENAGTIGIAPSVPASVLLTNGAVINNQSGGALDLYDALTSIASGTGANAINNGGTASYNGTAASIDVAFNNVSGGTLNVNTGVLSLAGDGNGDGPFVLGGDSVLDFPSGTYVMTPNGTVSGSGTLAVSGGALTIGGVTEPGSFAMSAGTLDGPGFLSVASTFTWSGGTITGTGGTQIEGTGDGYITGADGPMLLDGRTFDNYGYTQYSATTNTLDLDNGAVFSNYGTFDIAADSQISCTCSTPSLFRNAPNGSLQKTGTPGAFTFNVPTENSASVAVFDGTLEFAGDGYHTGFFFGSNGTSLVFSASSTDIDGSVVTNGSVYFPSGNTTIGGTYGASELTEISGANVTMNGTATTTDFNFVTGYLEVVDFHLTNAGTWSCGTIAGTSFTVDSGATLTIDSANSTVVLDAATLTNDGTINYTAAAVPGNWFLVFGGRIDNNGLFDLQTDQPITIGIIVIGDARGPKAEGVIAGNVINNYGTFQKSGGTLTSTIELDMHNYGAINALSGILEFENTFQQHSGSTTLGPGSILTPELYMTGGVLDGTGTLDGDVDNEGGDIVPAGDNATGVIDITGDFSQGSTVLSVLIELAGAAPGQFDQVNIGGTANFGGGFEATLIGGYEPPDATTFDVITYSSHSGTFDSETLPAYAGTHGSMTSSYTAEAFVLTAVVTPPAADLTISMNGPASIDAGDPLAYTITIGNLGPDPITGTTTVTNTLPIGATAASGSGTGWSCGAPAGGVITCTSATTIPVSGSLPVLTISMTAPADPGAISNSATATSSANDPSTPNSASVNTTVNQKFDLAITKNGPNGVIAGDDIVYTIVVTNNGPSTATGVVLADPTPAPLTWESNSGACTTAFPCNLGTLTAGQSVTVTSTFNTPPSFAGDVTNTATVSSTPGDSGPAPNDASKITNVGAQADLSVSKTGPATANPSQDVTYTIVVTNHGVSPATNVVIHDPTPVGIAFQSATGACTNGFPCNVGTLAAGQSVTIQATYTIPNNYSAPTVANTASASSDVNDPDPTDDDSTATTTIVPLADLSIAKSGPASVAPGQTITYTITVSNLGPSDASAVVVDDPTPPGLVPVSNSGACTTPFPCNLGLLTAGSSATITATFNVPANYSSASIENTATVSSAASDPNGSNDESTVTTPVVAQADVAVVKTGPPSFDTGQNVVYTIVVTNNGPLVSSNTFIDDPTPPGLTWVSNSGACTGPFPCALGSLAAGQSVTITAVFAVPLAYGGTTISNTATVSASTVDVNSANNSSTTITPRASGVTADLVIEKTGPAAADPNSLVEFVIHARNDGPAPAANVTISDPTPAGLSLLSVEGDCTGFPCVIATLAPNQTAFVAARYVVQAANGTVIANTATISSSASDPNPDNDSSTIHLTVTAAPQCLDGAPSLLLPANDAALVGPVTLEWTAVANAVGYVVGINGPRNSETTVTGTTLTVNLPPGSYLWAVTAYGDARCPLRTSASRTFIVCDEQPSAPSISAVAETTTGQTYAITWTAVPGVSLYRLEESLGSDFASPQTFDVAGTERTFTKNVTVGTGFFYRVRGVSPCGLSGPPSPTVRVAVLPVPAPVSTGTTVNVPDGSTTPVNFQIFVPGDPAGTTTFVATVDKPWLTVAPTSGIVPPAGVLLTISADPAGLVNGTWTGTVLVVYGANTVARSITTHGNTPPLSVPISISLVTPVTPSPFAAPAPSAIVIPAVGHLAGLDSSWRSDVRLANTGTVSQKYKLTFSPGTGDPAELLKTTTISVDAGNTTALDDIVRAWYGVGSLGESSNGSLLLEPLQSDGKVSPVASKTTAVSSRTFNATTATGSLGQFIPGLPISSFIRAIGGGSSLLSLQQLAQTDVFRTNLGILESSGRPASVAVSAFNESGAKLLEIPLSLKGGEQQQLNGFLAAQGLSLSNARIEVRMLGGEGLVTAYASVVDNRSGDPFLVFGQPVGNLLNRLVIPGVAGVDTGSAVWQSDVRLFNSGTAAQTATLTFFPTGAPQDSVSASVAIGPGEVKALDSVLQSLFGLTNASGALHVTTPADAPLTATARTFDQRPGGTVGQFVPAVAQSEAVGLGGRTLQVLQTEESVRYRTNLGIAEVTGSPAVVEITVNLPDSKIRPVVRVPLAANEFRQFPVLSALGLGALYNTRISVRVVEGNGRITAYGSVLDRITGDPTYIPPQ